MKTLRLALLSLLFPSFLAAQELTGFWLGILTNDSTKKEQRYELALSEYRGKVTGYSYTTFISNDTFYFSIKRMKATRLDTIWIVEDDEMVMHNFPEKPAKGVRQVNTFRLNKQDSTWNLDGNWKTTQTKRYYSLTGTMSMRVEENLAKSSLINHLEELNLQSNIVFYQDWKQKEAARTSIARNPADKKPAPANSVSLKKETVASNSRTVVMDEKVDPFIKSSETETTHTPKGVGEDVTKNSGSEKRIAGVAVASAQQTQSPPKTIQSRESQVKNEKPVLETSSVKTQKEETGPTSNIDDIKSVGKEEKAMAGEPANKDKWSATVQLPQQVAERSTEASEKIFFQSDSLILALYDNGVVDGDTVSVYMNGQNIMEKQKLKGVASKKTIYIPPGTDSVQLVLFAENLGTIPPNTGLLTIRDGETVHQVTFSANMQKNAALVLKRKVK